MKKIALFLSLTTVWIAQADTTNSTNGLDRAISDLNKVIAGFEETRLRHAPAVLPGSLRILVDRQLPISDAAKKASIQRVYDPDGEINPTNFPPSKQTGEETLVIFPADATNTLSGMYESRGLRPADLREMIAFAGQFTNHIGQFIVQTTISGKDSTGRKWTGLITVGQGTLGERDLSYYRSFFGNKFYFMANSICWMAGVRK